MNITSTWSLIITKYHENFSVGKPFGVCDKGARRKS